MLEGLPAVEALFSRDRQHRGEAVPDSSVRSLEADKGIVTAVGCSDYDASGSKIDSDLHSTFILRCRVRLAKSGMRYEVRCGGKNIVSEGSRLRKNAVRGR